MTECVLALGSQPHLRPTSGLPAQERGLVEAAVTHGLISVLITTAASIHSISWAADVSIFRLASVGKGSSQERSSCAK